MTSLRRGSGSRGATVVEAAFAIPIFFVLVLGLIDFGMFAFERNQASNAARDGARVGIINYRYLDSVGRVIDPKPAGAKDYQVLKAAIEKNLPGRTIPDGDLTVQCLTPAGAVTPCLTARVDVDRVRVRVVWDRKSITPLAAALGFASVSVEGDARMTIIGAPTAGGSTSVSPCAATALSVTPSSVTRTLGGQLENNLTFDSSTTGTCSNATIDVVSPTTGASTRICFSGCVPSTTYDRASTTPSWTPGTWTAVLRSSNGAPLRSTTFQVVDPPVPCRVTAVAVTPSPAQATAGGQLAADLTVNVSRTGTCTNLTVTMEAPAGGQHVLCSADPCVGNLTYLANQNTFWTSGTGRVRVSGEDTFDQPFTVTNAPPCIVTLSVERDPAQVDVQNRLTNYDGNISQRVTVGTTGPCPSLVVRMTTPKGQGATLCNTGACVGVHPYSKNSDSLDWSPVSGNRGVATVSVTGAGISTTTTFEVTK